MFSRFFCSNHIFLSVVVLVGLLSSQTRAATPCQTADLPCFCEETDGKLYLKCIGKDSETIASKLNATIDKIEFEEFSIVPVPDAVNAQELELIVENVLGGHTARVIRIAALVVDPSAPQKIRVDPHAFSSSQSTTEEIIIYDSDLSELDWKFLDGFSVLKSIHLQGAKGIDNNFVTDLPVLGSVTNLTMVRCENGFRVPSSQKLSGLTHLNMPENGLNINQILDILNQLVGSNLKHVSFRMNKLESYPSKLKDFTYLESVDLSFNLIGLLDESLPLEFNSPVTLLDMSDNKITRINGVKIFKGNFSKADIKLDRNHLESLPGDVFFDLTESMISSDPSAKNGSLSVTGNNITCEDCSLAWSVRDNDYLIYSDILVGECVSVAGSKPFTELQADDYPINKCPQQFTTSTTTTTTTPPSTTSTTTALTTPTTSTVITTTTITKPPTTTKPPTYQEQLYALFGIVGGLLLIIILGFGYMIYKMNKAKKALRELKPTNASIESSPVEIRQKPTSDQQFIGGYSTQPSMTTFGQPQPTNVLPRASVVPSQMAPSNGVTNNNPNQPRGLRRTQF